MSVFNVNIYIETTIKGPRTGRAAGTYLVEYITPEGIPRTRGKIFLSHKTTENALTLALIIRAFGELSKMCSVRVNTQCGHVYNAVKNDWIRQWEKNGWINAKGDPVKNAELWKMLAAVMKKHLVEFDTGCHSYQEIMQDKIWKALEGER